MIKKWSQFIKESVEESSIYWLDKDEMVDIFRCLSDESYFVNIEKGVFMRKKDDVDVDRALAQSGANPKWFDSVAYLDPNDDIILRGQSYFPGWVIAVTVEHDDNKDLTTDFRNAVARIESEGYTVMCKDEEGNIPIENIYFKNGEIISFIPEDSSKTLEDDGDYSGDIYNTVEYLNLYFYQNEEVIIDSVDLAEIYQWKNYTTSNTSSNIYCKIDIDDMSRYILTKYSYEHYSPYLINGVDTEDYKNGEYRPDTRSFFDYTLDRENEILAFKCIIKEIGGLEEFVSQNPETPKGNSLEGKSEDEVIAILVRDGSLNNDICQDSEVIEEAKQITGDWECSAHCSENEKEILSAFDKILDKEKIEYERILVPGKRFWWKWISETKKRTKEWYDDEIWGYEVMFENRWIEDYTNNSLYKETLGGVFSEWASNCNFEYDLNPYLSDWGNVDKVELNKELRHLFESYLKR